MAEILSYVCIKFPLASVISEVRQGLTAEICIALDLTIISKK